MILNVPEMNLILTKHVQQAVAQERAAESGATELQATMKQSYAGL